MHRRRQSRAPFHRHQSSTAEQAPGNTPQRQQPLGDSFDRFAIQNHHSKCTQALGKLPRRADGKQLPQRGSALGQKGLAQGNRQTPQFPVRGLQRSSQLLELDVLLETATATPLILQQGIGDQMHHERKGDQLLVAAATTPIPQSLQPIFVCNRSPQPQHALRQRHSCQRFFRWTIHVLTPCILRPANDQQKMTQSKDLGKSKTFTAVVSRPRRQCRPQVSLPVRPRGSSQEIAQSACVGEASVGELNR